LNVALDEIVVALATEERVSLSGFGTFDVRRRSSRPGRNPNTGDALTLPERRAVLFHAGRGLRQALAEGPDRQEPGTDATRASTVRT
jgi:nucleoid DNA-binding protein